ncbi:alpha/beta hydrolase [Oerskovia turbata]|uniref:Alpha/beta hydrolase n=1 Tax=Oerskovia turbata TaxID=1713 RepID=A0A4Q1KPT4_9CELL|nr:alpha/beta hydrolase [Oerskovia turbata]RXR22040.1 alpha/beta hydrolase [Oerskovia turbata]RXR32001.1 alpha/beta hydrolase [Oerskovia turbata]TGJ96890.1 alpha/beta hydrolase [Actinotalea fermentans ATCC 43279 = JCM 9966 = DSM 3133]
MNELGPRDTRAAAWSPPLPEANGFEHAFVETPGLRTHVASIGRGDPVVLLHGFPEHWWQWRHIAPAIATHGYRVICPDLRGSGWTEAADPRFGPESQLDDVIAVLDALGVGRAHFVCHDMGAISGMQLSYRDPGRVRTMLQLSVPPGFMDLTPKMMPAFAHMPALLTHRRSRSLRYLFGPRYVAKPMAEDLIAAYLCAHQRREVENAVAAMYRGMVVPVSVRLVRGVYRRLRLRPPTLTAFGQHDGPFAEPTARRICRNHGRHADRFELAFIDDAAHFVTDDAPDAVVALALDWFVRGASSPAAVDVE